MLSENTNCHKHENWAMHFQQLHAHDLMKNLWVGAAVVGFSRKCVCKFSCTEFCTTLYLSLMLLEVAVTETGITHHAGVLTLDCSCPFCQSFRSFSAQPHLNIASIITAGVDGGIGIPPIYRQTGRHRKLSHLGDAYSCHGHTGLCHFTAMAHSHMARVQFREKKE